MSIPLSPLRSRWHGRGHLLIAGTIGFVVVLAAGAFAALVLLDPMLPRAVTMATGAEGGGYAEFGQSYRQFVAQQGVRLTLMPTSGSLENLALLRSPDSGVGVALVQNGLTDPQHSPQLASLGTVAYLPLWIFYRDPEAAHDQLKDLRGMRVAIGPEGSGTRHLTLELLARNGIDDGNTAFLPFAPAEAAAHLLAGDIQAAMILAGPDAPAVRRLLASPDVRLLSLRRADTYVALYPFLTTVVLPAGFANLARDQPPGDVRMIAVKMSLLIRRDLPSALQYLLLEAATRIHSRPGVFQKAGEFPAAEGTDLPLSGDAQQFYKTGVPLLQRYLPLWVAVLIEQMAVTLFPAAAVAYSVLQTLPSFYGWRVQRRISLLYGELRLLEVSLEAHRRDKHTALSELAALEHRVTHLRLPSSFAHLLYGLRQDISLVRQRLEEMPSTQQRPSE
jgi:TRAP transporter TAXI family solute receptor